MKDTSWDHALEVTSDGSGLAGHVGAVVLRQLADRLGLTAALERTLTMKGKFPQLSRGVVLVSTAIAIALGATAMADIEVLGQLAPVLGAAPSDSTVRRVLDMATDRMLARIAQARARIRKHAWELIEDAGGFPWIAVAGKILEKWLVIDMDGTLITAHSDKENAKPTWKMGYGFHPLGAWLANTRECLAMLLRPGNAGSNTFTDHKDVLTAALKQVPAAFRRRALIRLDSAGASHNLVRHLLGLSTRRITVLFTCGWTILDSDEDAIAALPASAWQPGLLQDGGLEDDKDCAEITHLMSRAEDWPGGLRFIARRVKPSRRHTKNMTAFEKKTGWKYSITCTNIPHTGMRRRPRQPAPAVHRRTPARPRHRRDQRRPHRESDGTAQPPQQGLAGQQRLGPRREHRRRPHRLGPPPRPLRPGRTPRRHPGHAPLPDLEHPRPARPPRPETEPQDQPGLALERRVHHLLEPVLRPARSRLTSAD